MNACFTHTGMVVYNAKANGLSVFDRPPCANGLLGRSAERDGETWRVLASSESASANGDDLCPANCGATTGGRDVDLC